MKQNSLDRIKLMMNYDSSKTLNENLKSTGKVIVESSEVDVTEASGAALAKELRVAKAAGKTAEAVSSIARIVGVDLAKVESAVLKSSRELTSEMVKMATKDFKAGFKTGGGQNAGQYAREAGKLKAAQEILAHQGALTERQITDIIDKNRRLAIDTAAQVEKRLVAREAGAAAKATEKEVSTAAKAGEEAGAAAKAGEETAATVNTAKEAEAAIVKTATESGVKEGSVLSRNVEALKNGIKNASPKVKQALTTAAERVKGYGPAFIQRLKGLKLSWRKLVLYGLVGWGLYRVYDSFFGEDGESLIEGEDFLVMPPCVTNFPDEIMDIDVLGDNPVVMVKSPYTHNGTTYEGLKFYVNGRVFTYGNELSGSYTCKSATETSVEVNEQGGIVSGVKSVADSVYQSALNGVQQNAVGDAVWSLVDITWDGEESVVPQDEEGSSEGRVGVYHSCTDFPMGFGCMSSKVEDVQKCLGGLVPDGKLGPKTQAALGEDELTQELYDKIMADCAKKDDEETTKQDGEVNKSDADGTKTDSDSTTDDTSTSTETPKDGSGEAPEDVPDTTQELTQTRQLNATQLYQRLINDGLLVARNRGKKYVYKGPDLSREDRQLLFDFLAKMGYRESRSNFDFRKGDKYIYRKNEKEDDK